MSYFNGIRAEDSPSIDSFNRWRVSNPETEAEYSFEYDLLPLSFDQFTPNGASITHDAIQRVAMLTVGTTGPSALTGTVTVTGSSNPRNAVFSNAQTLIPGDVITAGGYLYYVTSSGTTTTHTVNGLYNVTGAAVVKSGSRAVLRQRQYNVYQKGKSQLIKETVLFGTGTAGVYQILRYGDDYNSIDLQFGNTGSVDIVERTFTTGQVVENRYPRGTWSEDNFGLVTGTANPSGLTLDLTKQQIWAVDAQFLGAGRIRTYFVINGILFEAHRINHSNLTTIAPYMQSFTLPISFEVHNVTGSSAPVTMEAICAEVESEGGNAEPNSYPFFAPPGNTALVSATTTRTHAISLRAKETINNIPHHINLMLEEVFALSGNQSVIVEVFYDSVLTGGSWVSTDANSALEYNTGATIVSVGTPMFSFPVQSGGAGNRGAASKTVRTQFPIVRDAFGANPRAITITLTTVTLTSSCFVTANWREVR